MTNRIQRKLGFVSATLAIVLLAACGGGGGGSGGGVLPGGTPTATPIPTPKPTNGATATPSPTPSASSSPTSGPTATPTAQPSSSPTTAPTPTATPAAITVSGIVVQMTGPLSSSVWNLAAPTGCPANPTLSCASYPTPPPTATLPAPGSYPTGNTGVAGVTVYVTTAAGAYTDGVPATILAQTTTGASGTFSVPVSGITGGTTIGLVAVNGSSIGSNGATNLGYTVAHATSAAASSSRLYIDTLSGDEQSAFSTFNAARAGIGQNPIVADTLAQAGARLAIAQRIGAGVCADATPNAVQDFYAIGGYAPTGGSSWYDVAGTQWGVVYNYGTPWNTAGIAYAGLVAIYNDTPCGSGYVTPINYYEGAFIQ